MNTQLRDDYGVEVHEEIVHEDGPLGVDRHQRVEVVRNGGLQRRQQIMEERAAAHSFALFQLTNLIWLLLATLEVLLMFRLALRLIAANPAAPFVALIYTLSDLFLWPFFGMVINPIAVNGSVLEITTIFAMFVYLALGAITVKLLNMASTVKGFPFRQVHVERRERL